MVGDGRQEGMEGQGDQNVCQASEVVQQLKALAAMPDDLSYVLKTHMVEEESQVTQVVP